MAANHGLDIKFQLDMLVFVGEQALRHELLLHVEKSNFTCTFDLLNLFKSF